MIVCHCRGLSDDDIHQAIDWMRAADPTGLITAGRVYRALGTRPDCGGCISLFVATMRTNDKLDVPAELTGLRRSRSEGALP
ncbi:(2Fe-2S)-binding protein [Rhodobacteraceae bacterium CCMM004]|nr:(2Fe-2S)-binding protein [Rhodobacteraceae bacterium CCMM004]